MTVHSLLGDHSFRLDYYGEHHMGAEHVCIRLDRPIDGVDAFHSTNGHAQFSTTSEHMIVYDACIILLLDYRTGTACHILPPRGWNFSNQRMERGYVHADFYGRRPGSMDPVRLDGSDERLRPGLGPAANGLLPSVHLPYYERIKDL